jgi:DMSO/TMAO reductase YedYZ molybdopterin-dependent catalytic subunit
MLHNVRMRTAAALLSFVVAATSLQAADVLTVSGDVDHELHLTAEALRAMPHVEVTAVDGHSKQSIKFRGVWVTDVLGKAGAPVGDRLRGKAVGSYVVAEAADGYRAVFSLAELDRELSGSEILIADSADGKPLGEAGPLRLVVVHDKRPARWIRNLLSLKVVTLPGGKADATTTQRCMKNTLTDGAACRDTRTCHSDRGPRRITAGG